MDPITLLAACFGGMELASRKASEFAQEAEGVWGHKFSKYAGLADQLEQHINDCQEQAPETQALR
jgi:hypothetical protein